MKKVRDQIAIQLEKVTSKSAINVFEAIQDKAGYKMVEEMIIKMMVNEQMTISGCIPHINEML
jgi:hypothetical protein